MANLKSIDTAFTQAVESKTMPGIVAVAVTDKGTLYEGAFGTREIGKNAPMTLDTVVWIASMTKAITATAAMQLVEQGKLSLDQPASATSSPSWRRRRCSRASTTAASRGCGRPSGRSRSSTCSPTPRASPTRSGARTSPGTSRRPTRRASPPARTPRSTTPLLFDPGRPLGLRHQHRLGRQDGRGGERAEARPLLPGQHPRPARHEGHVASSSRPSQRARLSRGAPARTTRARSRRSSSGCRRIRSS